MAKGNMCIVLAVDRNIDGVKKKKGTIILEGSLLNGASLADVSKAIQLKQVFIESREKEEKKEDKAEGSR